jgi:hypothetical protein
MKLGNRLIRPHCADVLGMMCGRLVHRRGVETRGGRGWFCAVMKMFMSVFFGAAALSLSGCMTSTVIHDARHPGETDSASWANYLLLPITVPADVVTSPVQLVAFISYARGERPRTQIGPIVDPNTLTNVWTPPQRLSSSKEDGDHY